MPKFKPREYDDLGNEEIEVGGEINNKYVSKEVESIIEPVDLSHGPSGIIGLCNSCEWYHPFDKDINCGTAQTIKRLREKSGTVVRVETCRLFKDSGENRISKMVEDRINGSDI